MRGIKGDHVNRHILVFFQYCAEPAQELICDNSYVLITRLIPAAVLRCSPHEEVGDAAYLLFLFKIWE